MAEHAELDWSKVRESCAAAPEAFAFVREGLAHTVKALHGEEAVGDAGPEGTRHVTGRQLCLGLREHAIQKYGMLARLVLSRWGVHCTEDFGRIVYAMIDAGMLRKSERDSFDDFRGVYDFAEAFAGA